MCKNNKKPQSGMTANSNFKAPRTTPSVKIGIIYAEGRLKSCTYCSEKSPRDVLHYNFEVSFLNSFLRRLHWVKVFSDKLNSKETTIGITLLI